MQYTTDLVTLTVPEGEKIILTFQDEEGEIDLTTHAVLIIDDVVRQHKTFMKNPAQGEQGNEEKSEKGNEEKSVNKGENIQALVDDVTRENQEKEVAFGEISLPESIEITVAQIKLSHAKAGELLASGVGSIISHYAKMHQEKNS
jgi:hypothetical protein